MPNESKEDRSIWRRHRTMVCVILAIIGMAAGYFLLTWLSRLCFWSGIGGGALG